MIGIILRSLLYTFKIKSIYRLIGISIAINIILSVSRKRSMSHFIISTLISTAIICYMYKVYEKKSKTKKWYIAIPVVDYIVDMII